MYRRILVPLDGTQQAESILPYVEDLARHYGASVVLLQVLGPIRSIETSILNPDPEVDTRIHEAEDKQEAESTAYLNSQCAELRRRKISVRARTARGPIVPTIVKIAAQENAELVAMANQEHRGLSKILHGDIAAGISKHLNRPVLMIRTDN